MAEAIANLIPVELKAIAIVIAVWSVTYSVIHYWIRNHQ